MLGDLDVIVETDPAALPLGIFVGFGRQRQQRRAVERLEQLAPAAAPAAQGPLVQVVAAERWIAALSAGSEKKRRLRRRARIQRPTT